MTRKSLNQTGFSGVEALLGIIVLLLVGFIGYYVYHSQHQVNATYNTASKIVQSSPAKSTAAASTKYFTIKEWGVKAPYSGSLTLEDSVSSGADPEYASFSSTQLDAVNAQCKSEAVYGGIIARYLATEEFQDEDGSDSGQTAAQYAATLTSSDYYAHVGNYYYFYMHPQGVCDTSTSGEAVMTQTDTAVEALTQSLQAE